MRSRRKSIAPWLFLIVGLLLLLGFAVAALPLLVNQSWLSPERQAWTKYLLEARQRLLPSEEQVRYLAWLAGIAVSALSAAFTLLASWHFAEMNLPQRIEDLKKSHTSDHLALRGGLLLLARRGLGPVAADIETSRLTLLRKWLSGWSKKEQARVLAASSNQLAREAAALSAAVREAQQQQITAHLVRGYQHASQDDDERAFEEFEAATKVSADDIVARDIAAGWARRINRQKRELELLQEMQQAASRGGRDIDHARALRREAELLAKRNNDPARVEALSRLRHARRLLQPLVADKEAMIELGRIHTLFCEVRCDRGRAGHLSGPNQPLTRAREYMTGVAMDTRPEEPDGEVYGEDRVTKIEERVREDPDAER